MRRVRLASFVLTVTVASLSHAGPGKTPTTDTPAGAGESSQVKASAESMLTVTQKEKPRVTLQKAESEHPGTPAIRGPKLPEAVRAHLKAQLDARVERDIVQIKELRGEAIKLLETF